MASILEQYSDKINGSFSFFDRMILNGNFTDLCYPQGRMNYLYRCNVLLKDFKDYSLKETKKICDFIDTYAKEHEIPYRYINNDGVTKEEVAREYLSQKPEAREEICILACLENCHSVRVFGSDEGKLILKDYNSKCKHYYIYRMDPVFGFMWIKIQTWFPFGMQVYINGREMMKQVFDNNGITYTTYDNSFSTISDLAKAQELADKFDSQKLGRQLNALAKRYNANFENIQGTVKKECHWTINQCEYATDIMFKEISFLDDIYPSLVGHAFLDFSSDDIFTFLGRKLVPQFQGEAVSDYKKRLKGIRVKYRINSNSIKFYNKSNCLRVETTFNNMREFKIYDEVHHKDGSTTKEWKPMSKSISVLYRVAEIGRGCNNRLINAMQNVVPTKSAEALIAEVSERVCHNNHHYAGLNLWSNQHYPFIREIMNGKYLLKGFRNSDIVAALYPSEKKDKKLVAKITRMIAKYRAHKLIKKVPHTNRYMVADKGNKIFGALIQAREKTFPEEVATIQ